MLRLHRINPYSIFARINRWWCQLRLLSFILISFHFLTICTNFPFILVPWGEIMTLSPQQRLHVCSVRWDTIAAAAVDSASNTPGRGRFLCLPFLGGRRRWSHFSEPMAIGTSYDDAPAASDISADYHASRDASVVDPAASEEDLHPKSSDTSPADADNRTI